MTAPKPLFTPDDLSARRQDRATLAGLATPCVHVRKTSSTTVTSGVSAAAGFDFREYESHPNAIWDTSTALYAPLDGLYRVWANLRWSASTSLTYVEGFFRHVRNASSTTTDMNLVNSATSGGTGTLSIGLSLEWPMLKGDYWQVMAMATGTGTVSFIGGVGGSRYGMSYVRPYPL